ncbi:hypothetical protein ACFLXN_02150 [Chloroflexota bacterium]
MRKSIVLTIAAILALFTTSMISCGVSTPEGTIKAYLNAINAQNADAMLELEIKGGRVVVYYFRGQTNNELLEKFSDFNIEDIQIERWSDTVNEVECLVSFTKKDRSTGEKWVIRWSGLFVVRKSETYKPGVWLIAGLDYISLG